VHACRFHCLTGGPPGFCCPLQPVPHDFGRNRTVLSRLSPVHCLLTSIEVSRIDGLCGGTAAPKQVVRANVDGRSMDKHRRGLVGACPTYRERAGRSSPRAASSGDTQPLLQCLGGPASDAEASRAALAWAFQLAVYWRNALGPLGMLHQSRCRTQTGCMARSVPLGRRRVGSCVGHPGHQYGGHQYGRVRYAARARVAPGAARGPDHDRSGARRPVEPVGRDAVRRVRERSPLVPSGARATPRRAVSIGGRRRHSVSRRGV
jgi:hypothetical protein